MKIGLWHAGHATKGDARCWTASGAAEVHVPRSRTVSNRSKIHNQSMHRNITRAKVQRKINVNTSEGFKSGAKDAQRKRSGLAKNCCHRPNHLSTLCVRRDAFSHLCTAFFYILMCLYCVNSAPLIGGSALLRCGVLIGVVLSIRGSSALDRHCCCVVFQCFHLLPRPLHGFRTHHCTHTGLLFSPHSVPSRFHPKHPPHRPRSLLTPTHLRRFP